MTVEVAVPFKGIMRCKRFSVKLPLGDTYRLLFFAPFFCHRITMPSEIQLN